MKAGHLQVSTAGHSGTEPLLTFQIITDTHVTADPAHEYNLNFGQALQDLAIHAKGSSGIMHIGDVTDHGLPEEYAEVGRILQLHQDALPEILYTVGNHDVGLGHWESRISMFTAHMAMPGPYHDHWIGGYHFIFLGTEENLPIFCNLSDKQLEWLDRKLGERAGEGGIGGPARGNAGSGTAPLPQQPVFLFLHQPLKDTVAGSLEAQEWYGVMQDEELRAILAKHPQTLLFTGHTHWELENDKTMAPGNGQNATMFNASSVAYLWTDADERKTGSQGYYVEVYADRVLVRGRDFSTGTWVESVQFTVFNTIKAHS
ncbi:metallophosphoesterase family protein [Paenibacillus sp. MMS20-IR301]|uniref:metallophosphoesterase family protein n=1 Tax=Paenibacillus sp. MMS20-IR301 TaxID=2895946 RepID=UPI0037C5E84B